MGGGRGPGGPDAAGGACRIRLAPAGHSARLCAREEIPLSQLHPALEISDILTLMGFSWERPGRRWGGGSLACASRYVP